MSPLAGVRFVDKIPEGEAFDAQIAVSSLPRAFATRLDSVPAEVPYLAAERGAEKEQWLRASAPTASRSELSGRAILISDQMARSIPLAAFAPLAERRDALA